MLSNSIILQSINKLIYIFNKGYDESFLKIIINKVILWFSKLANRSTIIRFLFSKVEFSKKADESYILNGFSRQNKVGIRKLLIKIIDSSLIIKSLIKHNANFYIFLIMLFSFPFISTSLALILGLGTILLTIASNIYNGNKFKYPKLYLFFMIIFIVSIVISAIFNAGPASSLEVFLIYIIFVSLSLFVPYIINNKRKINISLNIIVLITILLGIYGIYQFIFGAPMDEAWVDKEFASNVTRIYSVFGNPNVYGEYLVLVIPVIFALFQTTKNKILKLFYLGVLGLGTVNVLLTLSRGSMLSLAIAMVIIVLLKAHQYIPILAILAMISPFLLPEMIIRRIISVFTGDSSTDYRRSIYEASFAMLRDNYITGTGLGQFKELYKIYSLDAAKSFHAHNTILMIFIEEGLLGLFSFIAMMIAWVRDMLTTLTFGKGDTGYIEISILAGIIGCSIQGMVDHIWHNYDIMLIYFILLGIGCASAKLSKEERGVSIE